MGNNGPSAADTQVTETMTSTTDFIFFMARCRRLRRSSLASLAAFVFLSQAWTGAAMAAPGSGTVSLAPSAPVAAGAAGSWTFVYTAAESFHPSNGGVVEIEIPVDWTPPTTTPGQPGEVTVTSPHLAGIAIVGGRTIQLLLGAGAAAKVTPGDSVAVIYGGAGPAAATPPTTAPTTSIFDVRSDPNTGDGATPVTLAAGSPSLQVVPGPVAELRIEDGAGVAVGAFTRSADEDTTTLHLSAYDAFGNALGPVSGTWSVGGGIGTAAPTIGASTILTLTTVGSGRVTAAYASLVDSTGAITVTPGAYAALGASLAAAGTAGAGLSLDAEAHDADGNRITSGPGSGALLRVLAFTDSAGSASADPDLVADTVALGTGAFAGSIVARRAGSYWIGLRDESTGYESARSPVAVAADVPHHLVLGPSPLALVAGTPGTLTVEVHDQYENPSPLAANETLALWSNRPAGSFQDLAGNPIFDVTVPSGSYAASFRFRDTETTASPGTVRAIDTGFTAPFLGVGEVAVTTAPAAPAGVVALAATPDTLEADGAATVAVVSDVVRDAFGNAVPAGEPFTVVGTLVTPLADADGGTPGVQWFTDGAGVVSGSVGVGVTRGAGSVSIASGNGSASGAVALMLRAGPPSGAIGLTATPDTLVADGSSTALLSASGLADANGNPIEDGERFTVATDLGAITTPDADGATPGIQIESSGAALSFTVGAATATGAATVTAVSTRGSAAGVQTVTFRPGGVDASQSSVVATSPATVGATGSVVTVTLRDPNGNTVAGTPADSIALLVTGVPATSAPLAGATDAAGAIDFRVTSTVAGSASVTVTARGAVLADQPAIDFQPGALDHYTATGPVPPLVAGRLDTLRVTARDAFDNPVPAAAGSRLSVRVVAGIAAVPDTVTFFAAAADIPFTPIAASSLTLLAREVAPTLRSVTYGPVAVLPAGPYAIDSLYVASPTVSAGDSTLIAVWVDDAYGNIQPGATVAASVLTGSGTITPAVATTDGAGRAAFQLHGGASTGPLTVRAILPDSPAPDSIRAVSTTVQVVPAAAATIQITNGTGGIVAGGLLNVNLTLRDAFGNVAIGATPSVWLRTNTAAPSADNIRWSTTAGAAGSLADSAGSDGARYQFVAADSGTATLAVRDTLAETIRLRVDGPGLPLAETAPIVIQPGPPGALAIVSGNGQTGIAADTLASPLRVRARDAYGNPTPGAVVRFAVTAGGGSIDAIAGGGADTDAVADASGAATCDIWRLGTAAGSGNNAVRAALVATPSVFVPFIASASPGPLAALTLAPAALSLEPAQTATVTATALDAYGNPVPGAPLTLYLAGPAFGSLQSVGGATTGGPGSQSGTTGALGTLAVRYLAPSTAPAVDSIYVGGLSVGPVGIRVAVNAGATASLRITADSLSWTAGAPVRVRVVPLDAQGNVVIGDGADALMRSVAGVSFAPVSGPLASGAFQTFATATVAGTIDSIGADRSGAPGVGGAAGPVTVRPANPSGVIAVGATRTTLTADGRSVATVTFGPVRDAYGNVAAAGTTLLASTTAGVLAATSLATDAAGFASTVLIAPTTAGSGTVDVASSPAGAAGSLGFTFLAPPSLAAAAASLSPTVVAPGGAAAFQVDVTNGGAAPLTLGGGTQLSFGPSGALVTAGLASAPVVVPASQSVTLAFASASLPTSLPPGTYAPTLRAVGTDATGEAFDFYPSLAGAAVHVAGVRVAAVGAAPDPAPLGYADLQLTFTVENLAAAAATIESGSVAFSIGTFAVNNVTPTLPVALPALGTQSLVVSVRVPSAGIADGASVDAALTAGVRYGAVSVSGTNASPLSFRVVSGAAITPVAGATTPARLLRLRTFAPTVRVRNDGTADVTLLRGPTELVLGHAGGDTLRATLRANQVVSGGGQVDLAFDSLSVPGSVATGFYGVTLVLRGTESGQPFAADLAGSPPVMEVLDPAILSVTSLAPDTVSAGQSRPVRVMVSNAGGVAYQANLGTTLRLDAPVSRTLTITAAGTVPAGGSAAFDFAPAPLGAPGSPGAAAATLEARGTEDGRARDESVAAGTLHARPPASLTYVAGSTSPDTVRAGLSLAMTVAIRNDGGSPLSIDPAATRLVISDGVESAIALGSGAPFTLGAGGQAVLAFPTVDFPPALASQAYPVTLVVNAVEWGLAESLSVASPPGELRVVEPAPAVQVRSLDVGAPTQTAVGAGVLRIWGLEIDPLLPAGGAASTRLESIALTVLVDGAPTATPGAAVATVELRDASGTLLAQASPAAANPVPLAFTPPVDLSGGAFACYVDVTLNAGFDAADVGMRLANAGDVVARDDLTGAVVPITATGGLPFAPIDSRRVTLFAKAHGYPNPFRAGRESVLLSYRLAADAAVRVRIATLFGELVRELSFPAGTAGGARGLNEVPWDGRNGAGALVMPGVYVARIEGGGVGDRIKIGVRR